MVEAGAHTLQKRVEVERLVDHWKTAGVSDIAVGSDNHPVQWGHEVARNRFVEQPSARVARQGVIAQDKRVSSADEQAERFLSRSSAIDLITFGFEYQHHERPQIGAVFNQQNA
jgi:hypothetical protein